MKESIENYPRKKMWVTQLHLPTPFTIGREQVISISPINVKKIDCFIVRTEFTYWKRLSKKVCTAYPPGSADLTLLTQKIELICKRYTSTGSFAVKVNTQPYNAERMKRVEIVWTFFRPFNEIDKKTFTLTCRDVDALLT